MYLSVVSRASSSRPDSSGVYLKDLPVDSVSPPPPSSFLLNQNYPNPFNPSTTIEYDVPLWSHITLTIYDVLGRKVETLVNGERSPGHYEVKSDASKLASGVYFSTMRTESFAQTKKLMVIK